MRRSLAAAFFLLGWLPHAHALFVKTQMERIDHETLFDSEYFIDLLSFSTPLEWEDSWRASTAPVSYRINSASLDCCDLLLQQELRLRKDLGKGWRFKFRLLQDEDKERQELHHRLELEKSLGAGFSALLFGEPAFRKEDSDIGVGLAYARGPFKASARRNFVDFNFNQRGSTSQNYSRKPLTDDISFEYSPSGWRLSSAVEIDHPLRRQVPAENRVFSYRRTTAVLGVRHEPVGAFSRRLEYRYEFQKKGDLFNPDPAVVSIENQRQVHRVLAAVEGALSPDDRLEAGGVWLTRAARTDNAHASNAGAFHRRWEVQPYARWRRLLNASLVGELAGFFSFGENRRRFPGGSSPALFDGIVEAKLGAGLDFLFGPSGRLGIYSTFDADGPGHPWDGGNIRAMFLF